MTPAPPSFQCKYYFGFFTKKAQVGILTIFPWAVVFKPYSWSLEDMPEIEIAVNEISGYKSGVFNHFIIYLNNDAKVRLCSEKKADIIRIIEQSRSAIYYGKPPKLSRWPKDIFS